MKIRYSVSDGPRGYCARLSVARVDSTVHPQVRQNTRLTTVHREVRPSRHPPARSPRRVRARRRGQFAFKMRFHIDKPNTSIGQNPFTETIHFRKHSVSKGVFVENTHLRELRRRRDFGGFGRKYPSTRAAPQAGPGLCCANTSLNKDFFNPQISIYSHFL